MPILYFIIDLCLANQVFLKFYCISTTTMITILSISFIVFSMEAILMYNPKLIEKLNKKTGIIQDYHFNLKNSRGYLYLKTFDNNLIKFTIRTIKKYMKNLNLKK